MANKQFLETNKAPEETNLDQAKILPSKEFNVIVQILAFFGLSTFLSIIVFSLIPSFPDVINFPFAFSKEDNQTLTWLVKRIVSGLVSILSAIVASILCIRRFTNRSPYSIGYQLHKGYFKDLFLGCLISFLMVSFIVLFQWFVGGTEFSLIPSYKKFSIFSLLITFYVICIAAFEEEILFRGYPLQTLAIRFSPLLATIITSSLFGLAHLGNPNVTFFSTANTILAGVWLCVAYFKTRSLSLATGLHLSWNFSLGVIYGLPVSGIVSFANYSFLETKDLGKTWLTGGNYGPEGGAIATITLILGIVFLLKFPFLKISPEMAKFFPSSEESKKTEITSNS
jgi:hypothetical protein